MYLLYTTRVVTDTTTYSKEIIMDKKQTMDDLVNRYGMDMKKLIYPLLVLHVIKSHKKASSQEIKSEINRIAGKEVEYQYTSYYRLMSNLEHDRELIEPVELVKEKGPARIYYSLTPKGEELLGRILNEIIYPVIEILPKQ